MFLFHMREIQYIACMDTVHSLSDGPKKIFLLHEHENVWCMCMMYMCLPVCEHREECLFTCEPVCRSLKERLRLFLSLSPFYSWMQGLSLNLALPSSG